MSDILNSLTKAQVTIDGVELINDIEIRWMTVEQGVKQHFFYAPVKIKNADYIVLLDCLHYKYRGTDIVSLYADDNVLFEKEMGHCRILFPKTLSLPLTKKEIFNAQFNRVIEGFG